MTLGHDGAGALIEGTPLAGHWFNRTLEFAARLRREDVGPIRYTTVETVTFSPIPCWAHLSHEVYRVRIAEMVEGGRSCPSYSSISTLKDGGAGADLRPCAGALWRLLTASFERRIHVKRSVGFAVVLLLGMCHLVIADPAIKPGIDVFTTVGRGFTYYNFAKNPIPAGFFCDSSATFTGRLAPMLFT
jgi:hypothetical protein